MEKKERKPGSGGARPGAGIKPVDGVKKEPISLRLTSDVIRIIKSKANQAAFVENAVSWYEQNLEK